MYLPKCSEENPFLPTYLFQQNAHVCICVVTALSRENCSMSKMQNECSKVRNGLNRRVSGLNFLWCQGVENVVFSPFH